MDDGADVEASVKAWECVLSFANIYYNDPQEDNCCIYLAWETEAPVEGAGSSNNMSTNSLLRLVRESLWGYWLVWV